MEDPWADPSPSKAAAAPLPSAASPAAPTAPSSGEEGGFGTSPTVPFESPMGEALEPSASGLEVPPVVELTSAPAITNDAQSESEVDPYASTPSVIPPISAPSVNFGHDADAGADDGFDDFDDFDEPAAAGPSGTSGVVPGNGTAGGAEVADDDFGDFDDFEDAPFESVPMTVDAPQEASGASGGSGGWGLGTADVDRSFRALSLDPVPDPSSLLSSISALLQPLYPSTTSPDPSSLRITSEAPREQPPLKQVLINESSRDHYVQLCSPPSIKPLDWTRSRVRRDHLISLGIPVNLDEVDSHRLSAMPMLSVTTEFGERERERARRFELQQQPRSASLDVGGKNGQRGPASRPQSAHPGLQRGSSYAHASASGSGSPSSRKNGLGERPDLDWTRAEELCGIEEDQLSLLKPSTLKKLRDDLQHVTEQASARLAWELQHKDSQTKDSATYNGMISELIATAAKAKSAQQVGGGGGVFRRSSARRPQSGSATPGSISGRIGSPGMR